MHLKEPLDKIKGITMQNPTKEVEILKEIRNSEKESEEIVEKARKVQERILDAAKRNSLKLLDDKKVEIIKEHEENLGDFKEKISSIKKEKLEEGKKAANQMKERAEKNVSGAVDFVMKKFEAAVNALSKNQNKNREK